MLFHPKAIRLTDYAIGELPATESRRLKSHLARCSRCRQAVASTRQLMDEAKRQSPAGPPPDLWSRIVKSAQSGRKVILPVADPPPASARGFGWLAATVSSVIIIAAIAVFRVVDLRADRSELSFVVNELLPDQEMAVTYRGTGMFDGEQQLVIRARYRNRESEPYNADARQVLAAELRRTSRREYRGVVRPPADAVYAAFVVEEVSGRVVDSNRQLFWELLEQANGVPTYDALVQKQHDHMGRSWQVVHETARLKTRLYPENPASWAERLVYEQLAAREGLTSSVMADYRARLAAFDKEWSTRTDAPEEVLTGIYMLARAVDGRASPVADRWRTRLIREAPRNPGAVTEMFVAIGNWEDPVTTLRNTEALWTRGGPHEALAEYGYRVALRTADPRQILSWADRLEAFQPSQALWIAMDLSTNPALRDIGVQRLRGQLQLLDDVTDTTRPLGRTADWNRHSRASRRQQILTALGQALLLSDEQEAGLLALEWAAEDHWNLAIFEALAKGRLVLGDTSGSVTAMAAIAVDPNTSAAVKDSLTKMAADLIGESSWEEVRTAALATMYEYVLERVVAIPVTRGTRVVDLTGKQHDWNALISGKVTVVGTSSRYDGISLNDVAQLQEELTRSFDGTVSTMSIVVDVRLVGDSLHMTRDPHPSLPKYYDASGKLRQAYNWWGLMSYFVLDANGRMRFIGNSKEDVLRQVATLVALEDQSIVADNAARPNQP